MLLKKMLATAGTAVVLAAGSTGLAAPTQAAPVITGGLFNVTIVDAIDISRVVVQLPVAAAANVCDLADVQAALLAIAAQNSNNTANCTAIAGSRARGRATARSEAGHVGRPGPPERLRADPIPW